ncbi:MAG: alpha/beta fold hydrolase, partial [Blastocatellia bacterium]
MGRTDNQVKIRGFRIELGEIESVLSRHPSVCQCAVVLIEKGNGEKRLMAYVASDNGAPPSGELRSFLKMRLPDYMVPVDFVTMEHLPLTQNGKVDRKSLARLAPVSSRTDTYLAPGNATELRLSQLWEEILNVKPVGVDNDFFELGGHSLLTVQLISRMNAEFGIRIALTALFQSPTIRSLASAIRADRHSGNSSPLVPLGGSGTKLPIFCVHGLGGGVIDFLPLARLVGADQPVYGFEPDGDEPHQTSIVDIAARYRNAMTDKSNGPYCLLGWSFGGLVAFEMALQLTRAGREVALLALLDCLAPVPCNKAHYLQHPEGAEPVDLASFAVQLLDAAASVPREEIAVVRSEGELTAFLGRLQQAHILPSEVTIPDLLKWLRRSKREAKAAASYQPGVY